MSCPHLKFFAAHSFTPGGITQLAPIALNICATDFVHRSNWVLSSSHLLTCLMQSNEHVDNAGIVSTRCTVAGSALIHTEEKGGI